MSYKFLIRIIISAFFLVGVFIKIDFPLLFNAFLDINLMYYFVSLLLLIANSIVLALKFKIVMTPSQVYQPLLELVKINFICRFYSMFLTTAIGQSVIRWHISTKNQVGRLKFIAVMLFERSSFVFILLLVLAISLKVGESHITNAISEMLFPLIATGLSGLVIFYFLINFPSFYKFIKKIMLKFNTNKNKTIISKLTSFIDSFSIFLGKYKILVSTLFLSIIWHLFFLLKVYFIVLSLEIPLDFINISWIASVVLFFQMLPISFNGIGIREAAYAFFFGFFNISPEKSVLLGILLLSQILIMSIVGGLFHLLSKK